MVRDKIDGNFLYFFDQGQCYNAYDIFGAHVVKDDKGKPQALSGQHDDLVMALAIAHHVGGEQGDHEWQDTPVEKDIVDKLFGEDDDDGGSGYSSYMSWE